MNPNQGILEIAHGNWKALLLLCIVSMAFLFSIQFTGEFGLNDDPVYSRAVRDFAFFGKYYPENYSSIMLLQILYGTVFVKIFGYSHTILRVSVMLLSVLGILLFFVLSRQFGFSEKQSFLVSLLFLANPFFVVLGHSFMADVPFTVILLAAIAPLVDWAKTGNKKALIAGCIMLALAFLIKQWAILFFAGLVFFVFFFSKTKKAEKAIIAVAIVFFAIAFAWSLPHYALDDPGTFFKLFAGKYVLPLVFGFPLYVSFFLFPFAIAMLFGKKQLLQLLKNKKKLLFSVIFAAAGIVAGFFVFRRFLPYFSNVLNPFGLGPKMLSGEATGILPEWFWLAMTVFSAISIMFVINSFDLKIFRKREKLLVACMSIVYLLQLMANPFFMDRYFLPLLPIAFLLVLEPLKEKKRFVAGIAATIVFFGAFSFVFTSEYISWNQKAWQLINELKSQGIPYDKIDGGLDYCIMTFGQDETRLVRADTKYYTGICTKGCSEEGYAISFKPLPGCSVVKSEPYFVLGQKFGEIFVLKK